MRPGKLYFWSGLVQLMKELFAYIHSLMPFSDASWEVLLPALTPMTFGKGDYLLQEGKTCNALYFVSRGYCRAFYNKEGQEINTDFFFEQQIATNISSFATGTPSAFAIQACEALEAVRFDKLLLRAASAQDLQIEALGRQCLRQIAIRQEQHSAMYKLMTALERYEYLEQSDPELLQRVSLTQLASYLGVARETLSRIRSRRS